MHLSPPEASTTGLVAEFERRGLRPGTRVLAPVPLVTGALVHGIQQFESVLVSLVGSNWFERLGLAPVPLVTGDYKSEASAASLFDHLASVTVPREPQD